MNTSKCPSKMPRFWGLLLIIIVAPVFFILGFGANKIYQNKALNSDHINVPLSQPTEIATQSGSRVFIYADVYTLSRNDAVYSVTDINGNTIPITTLQNQKKVPLDGKKVIEFAAIASFTPTTDKVVVSCSNSGNSHGEYFVGSEVSTLLFNPLMFVFFALGIVVMALGCMIWIKNVLAIQKWTRQHAG